jgi:hypothetical protein
VSAERVRALLALPHEPTELERYLVMALEVVEAARLGLQTFGHGIGHYHGPLGACPACDRDKLEAVLAAFDEVQA